MELELHVEPGGFRGRQRATAGLCLAGTGPRRRGLHRGQSISMPRSKDRTCRFSSAKARATSDAGDAVGSPGREEESDRARGSHDGAAPQASGGLLSLFPTAARKDAPIYVPPTKLMIVGTATLPAVGFASIISDHTSMGTGAFVSNAVLPTAFLRAMESPDATLNGPNLALVRMRCHVSPSAGRADLQRIARAANRAFADVPDGGGQATPSLLSESNVQRRSSTTAPSVVPPSFSSLDSPSERSPHLP